MARIISPEALLGRPQEDVEISVVESIGEEKSEIKCPQCDFVAKSPFGLKSHLRKHKE